MNPDQIHPDQSKPQYCGPCSTASDCQSKRFGWAKANQETSFGNYAPIVTSKDGDNRCLYVSVTIESMSHIEGMNMSQSLFEIKTNTVGSSYVFERYNNSGVVDQVYAQPAPSPMAPRSQCVYQMSN